MSVMNVRELIRGANDFGRLAAVRLEGWREGKEVAVREVIERQRVALAAARLQGWREGRDAAAAWLDQQASYLRGTARNRYDASFRRLVQSRAEQDEESAAEIRLLPEPDCPDPTP